ncbi:MAG: hypothetical protein WC459_02240 [Patescibacteria group bacterium]
MPNTTLNPRGTAHLLFENPILLSGFLYHLECSLQQLCEQLDEYDHVTKLVRSLQQSVSAIKHARKAIERSNGLVGDPEEYNQQESKDLADAYMASWVELAVLLLALADLLGEQNRRVSEYLISAERHFVYAIIVLSRMVKSIS